MVSFSGSRPLILERSYQLRDCLTSIAAVTQCHRQAGCGGREHAEGAADKASKTRVRRANRAIVESDPLAFVDAEGNDL
jgi:hypothetical protein